MKRKENQNQNQEFKYTIIDKYYLRSDKEGERLRYKSRQSKTAKQIMFEVLRRRFYSTIRITRQSL